LACRACTDKVTDKLVVLLDEELSTQVLERLLNTLVDGCVHHL
jgi:hypothetical protein